MQLEPRLDPSLPLWLNFLRAPRYKEAVIRHMLDVCFPVQVPSVTGGSEGCQAEFSSATDLAAAPGTPSVEGWESTGAVARKHHGAVASNGNTSPMPSIHQQRDSCSTEMSVLRRTADSIRLSSQFLHASMAAKYEMWLSKGKWMSSSERVLELFTAVKLFLEETAVPVVNSLLLYGDEHKNEETETNEILMTKFMEIACSTTEGGSSGLSLNKEHHPIPFPRKSAPIVKHITVETMLRNAELKESLQKWWDAVPKVSEGGEHGGGEGYYVVLKSTFAGIVAAIHDSLLGNAAWAMSSEYCINALELMSRSDVDTLLLSAEHNAKHGNKKFIRKEATTGMDQGGPQVALGQTLFFASLLAVLEPYMETTLVLERKLALALLFPHVLVSIAQEGSRPMSPASPRRGPPKAPRMYYVVRKVVLQQDKPAARQSTNQCTEGGIGGRDQSMISGGLPDEEEEDAKFLLADIIDQLDATHDDTLFREQVNRNRAKNTTYISATESHWRSELRKQRADFLSDCNKRAMSIIRRRDVAPSNVQHSYSLERTMLQRLARCVASEGQDAPEAVERSAVVRHAALDIIPAEALRRFARWHPKCVDEFREIVDRTATAHTLQTQGPSTNPPLDASREMDGSSPAKKQVHYSTLLRSSSPFSKQLSGSTLSSANLQHPLKQESQKRRSLRKAAEGSAVAKRLFVRPASPGKTFDAPVPATKRDGSDGKDINKKTALSFSSMPSSFSPLSTKLSAAARRPTPSTTYGKSSHPSNSRTAGGPLSIQPRSAHH